MEGWDVQVLFRPVTEEAVEGMIVSNDCALTRSQKRCPVMLYYVLLRFVCYAELPVFFLLWNSSDSKGEFSFYAFITNNKVLLYLFGGGGVSTGKTDANS